MLGNGVFFSPVVIPPRNTTSRRPWQELTTSDNPNGRNAPDPTSSDFRRYRPMMAASSFSSAASSPGRSSSEANFVRQRRRPVNHDYAPQPGIARIEEPSRLNRRGVYSARICRICSCLAILASLCIVLVARLVVHGERKGPRVMIAEDDTNARAKSWSLDVPAMHDTSRQAKDEIDKADAQNNFAEVVLPLKKETPPIPMAFDSSQTSRSGSPLVMEDSAEGSCWIYMHMEKSGGDLIRNVATEHWRRDALIYDNVQWRRGVDYAMDVKAHFHWRLLHGGCVEALRQYEGRSCKSFTVFRHPVARLLSAFNHCKEASQDPLCLSTSTMDLETFAERWGNFALRQFAMATVSADVVKEWATRTPRQGGKSAWFLLREFLQHGRGPHEAGLEDLLEPVKKVLSTEYVAVGIVEEIDTTMRLFDKALSMPKVDWSASLAERLTVNSSDGESDVLEEKALVSALKNKRILAAVKLDVLLYEHAVGVFREQVERHGIK